VSYYEGKVKVVGNDLMCFPADPKTLEPLACSTYDAWARSDPDHDPIETIGFSEWLHRREECLTMLTKPAKEVP
jgi:hypothetical protein